MHRSPWKTGWRGCIPMTVRNLRKMWSKCCNPGNTLGFDSEYRFDDNAGGYHWLQSVGRVLQRDSAGRPLLAAGYSVNIDERKKAEEELRKLSLAMEQSPESIVITNLDAEIEYVNAAFVQNTGYRREEVIGQNPRILHSGKTPQATFDSLWQTITAGETWKGEFHNRRRDASEYIEFAIITPLRQDDGKNHPLRRGEGRHYREKTPR
jgi:two-component system sensor histidine kinase/response regulator